MTRPEKITKATELRAQGWTQKRIADALGVTQQSISSWLRPEPPKPIDRRVRAAELRARGWTYERIGRELGVSMTTAVRWTNPQYAQADREYKDAHRIERRGSDKRRAVLSVKCRHCQKPTGAIDEAGEPCCRACRTMHELAADKATATCACGERMLVATPDGLCGFCREERHLGIAA